MRAEKGLEFFSKEVGKVMLKKSSTANRIYSALMGRHRPYFILGRNGSSFGFKEQGEIHCLLNSLSFSA